jgi:hypothetical protein
MSIIKFPFVSINLIRVLIKFFVNVYMTMKRLGRNALPSRCEQHFLLQNRPKMNQNRYLYIKAAKSFFNVPREKLSPRPLAAEAEQCRGC